MTQPIWTDWLGLPHEIGADPRHGRAACCLVMAKVLLDQAGLQTPEIDDWLKLARNRNWVQLQLAFDQHCEPVIEPAVNTLTLMRNGVHGLGIGTVVSPELLILPHHRHGVITFPLHRLRFMQYRRLRQ